MQLARRPAGHHHTFPEALARTTHADTMLAGLASQELQERARSWRADLEMVKTLEDIQLQKTDTKDGQFDMAGADAAYRQAFRDYGIDVLTLEPPEAARRVRTKAIRAELAAGLDDWSDVCWSARNRTDPTWKNLLVIARAADPDDWRDKFRQVLFEKGNKHAWKEFASSLPTKELPPPTLVILGKYILPFVGAKQAIALLRQAQIQYPGDFWINYQLAQAFNSMQPPQREQAIRYFTVALALRPQSPVAHRGLAYALAKNGALDEAITLYEKAIQLKPDDAQGYIYLGILLRDHRRLSEAALAFRKGSVLKPDHPFVYVWLGHVLRRQGKLPEAVTVFAKMIEIEPANAEAHFYL